jgi:sialidase-1
MKAITLITCLSFFLLQTFSTVSAAPVSGVTVTSTSAVVPVFKGIANNELLRLRVDVPAGAGAFNLKAINTRLNPDALKAVDKIQVYFTDQEPGLNTSNLLTQLKLSGTNENIPVNLSLKPGVHYIWFTAALKESADIDAKLEFHVDQVESNTSTKYKVAEQGKGYLKRLGIAVRKAGDQGVNTFRIPGMATTNTGKLITVYDIRYQNSRDLPGNIDVGMSRSTDGGKTWEPMKVIMDMGEPNENNGVGDPAVLFDPVTKKIWVAALWSKGNRSIAGSRPGLSEDVTGQLVLVSSSDDGRTWSKPQSITSKVKDPAWNLFFNGPGSGIAMANGTLVFAAQYWDENAKPYSTIVYSADHGANWKTEDGPKSNTTESQVIETRPSTLMLNMRDNRGRYRSVATTTDMGKTWVEHPTSYQALPDPVCMASFIKTNVSVNGTRKDVVFFANNNNLDARYDLTIKASTDLAETWPAKSQLLIDERRLYGYSSLTKINDRMIGIFYEGAGDLYFVRVPVNEIIK